nr:DUF4394 domain-containing protein [Deltaproteobacteria bacterium]
MRKSAYLLSSLLTLTAACGDNLEPQEPSDPTPGRIEFAIAEPADEAGEITVTATRTGGSTGAVSVTVAVADGTATATIDYAASPTTLTWADGDTAAKTFTVGIVADLAIEGDETALVQLTNPTGGVTLAETQLTLTIKDDDRLGVALVLTPTEILSVGSPDFGITSSAATLTGVPSGVDLVAMDVRPADGSVWALGSNGTLFTIDPASGAVTLKATLAADAADGTSPFTALAGTEFGIDFNPVVDRLRIVSDTGQNLRVNPDTGATFTDTALSGAVTGLRANAYSNSFATACRTTLFGLDLANDRLVLQDPPNAGTTTSVGALGVDVTEIRGFDTQADATGATSAFILATVGGVVGVYDVDLATGEATSLTTGGTPDLSDAIDFALTVAVNVPQPPGELFGASAGGKLVSFTRATPGKLCSSVAITGITAGETIAGIDFRPSTGVLHALTTDGGNTGRIYTLDPQTGVATSPVSIAVAIPTGAELGIDFNPTGPVALRIVSSAGLNVRVTDLATGAATADTALNGANDSAAAAGYTDSITSAGSTVLYVLDTELDRLRIQNPPNAGTLVDVGAFGVDLDDLASLDIDGRDNVAYVTANLTGSTGTSLHILDLTTGAVAAAAGVIGGGERILGITRTPPTTTLFALQGNTLVTINPADPSSVTTIGAVTNLSANEQLLGIDFRPSTGILYGLGSLGGVYTIDPATAAGTRIVGLSADPADGTLPFTTLGSSPYGIDFNPTGPVALRIVGQNDVNLRVPNVTTGLTFTDTDLSRTVPTYAITATAYANNVAGATTTSLFGLDANANKLVAVVSPNSGIVREIGNLGLTVGTSATFEIAGPNTGFAVLQADTAKSFATIDLTTGVATAVGTVGVPANASIVGIAAPVSATAPAANSTVFA